MKKPEFQQNLKRKKLPTGRRKAVSLSSKGLIEAELLQPEKTLTLVVQPTIKEMNLVDWAMSNREFIETHLLKHGAILFRNFNVNTVAEFEQFIMVTSDGELLQYTYRSTPRSQVSGRIYTTTEYPANQSIPLHNENAYQCTWPLKIFFFCVTPAQQGGETPIADSRKVFERIDPKIRSLFMEKKVMYVRNYSYGLDLPWQNVFQTEDKSEVEAYCHNNFIEFEWKDSNCLRTKQNCQAVAKHPKTGEMVWFNQAHLFHVSSLELAIRKCLLAEFKEEELSRNAYYGDGSPIKPSVLDEIRKAYLQETISLTWQKGDILLLDNMLTAHGRAPFVGPRKVLVGMSEPFSCKDI
jgi:alpha-ketoglutarate-dependent taurine dioxygenase